MSSIFRDGVSGGDRTYFVDARQRAININTNNPYVTKVCTEKFPDVFAVAAAMGKVAVTQPSGPSGSLNVAQTEQAAEITFRTQVTETQQVLLYYLCQMNANGQMTDEELETEMRRFQNTMLAMLAVEQLTGVAKTSQLALTATPPSDNSANDTSQASETANSTAKPTETKTTVPGKNPTPKPGDKPTGKPPKKPNEKPAKTVTPTPAEAQATASVAVANAVTTIVQTAIWQTFTTETCLKVLFGAPKLSIRGFKIDPASGKREPNYVQEPDAAPEGSDLRLFCLDHLKRVDDYRFLTQALDHCLVSEDGQLKPLPKGAVCPAMLSNSGTSPAQPSGGIPVPVNQGPLAVPLK